MTDRFKSATLARVAMRRKEANNRRLDVLERQVALLDRLVGTLLSALTELGVIKDD